MTIALGPGFDSELYGAYNDLPRGDESQFFWHYLQNYCGEHYASPGSLICSAKIFDAAQRDEVDALIRILSKRQPEFQTKWKSLHYLCVAFGRRRRLRSLVFNYRFLMQRLAFAHLSLIFTNGITVWSEDVGGERWSIAFGFSQVFWEGELSLTFQLNDKPLYILSFSIIEGRSFDFEEDAAIMITRLQGVRHQFELIHKAAKTFNDVHPLYSLFAGLKGLAAALGITRMVGIAAAFHGGRAHQIPVDMQAKYDEFYLKVGMAKHSAEIFTAALPIFEKPLSDIKKGHRLRTKAKRAFKSSVSEAVRVAVVSTLNAQPASNAVSPCAQPFQSPQAGRAPLFTC